MRVWEEREKVGGVGGKCKKREEREEIKKENEEKKKNKIKHKNGIYKYIKKHFQIYDTFYYIKRHLQF